MKLLNIIKEDEDSNICDELIARAKKLTPLLVDGIIKGNDLTIKYVLVKELYYRCSKHERSNGTIERYVFPTLEANQNGSFPFEVYMDGEKTNPNLWTPSTKIMLFKRICKHIEEKCLKFNIHFASKMH